MKTTFLVIAMACAHLVAAQDFITHSEVVEVEGVSANQLFTTANEWFALTFNDANEVIQMNDFESKQIIAKGVSSIGLSFGKLNLAAYSYFTLKFHFKDGRYKYEFTQIRTKLKSGDEYQTIEEWNERSTYEGQLEYNKRKNINSNLIGKRAMEKNAVDAKNNYDIIMNDIQVIANNFKEYIANHQEENW